MYTFKKSNLILFYILIYSRMVGAVTFAQLFILSCGYRTAGPTKAQARGNFLWFTASPQSSDLTHLMILIPTSSGSPYFITCNLFCFVQNSVPRQGPTCFSGVPNAHSSVSTQLLLLTLVSLDTHPSHLAGLQLNPWVTYTDCPRLPPPSIWAFVYFQIHLKKI